MGSNKKLVMKAIIRNEFMEQVENWFLCLQNKTYQPPSFEKTPERFYMKHENVIVAGHVEFYGFGKVQKVVTVGSDKYRLDEIPEVIYHTILSAYFSDGETHLNPKLFIMDPEAQRPKFRLVAYWEPPGDYVKQLKEKRNFVTHAEFMAIAPHLLKIYAEHGVKAPNYITDAPFIQVPDKVH